MDPQLLQMLIALGGANPQMAQMGGMAQAGQGGMQAMQGPNLMQALGALGGANPQMAQIGSAANAIQALPQGDGAAPTAKNGPTNLTDYAALMKVLNQALGQGGDEPPKLSPFHFQTSPSKGQFGVQQVKPINSAVEAYLASPKGQDILRQLQALTSI